MARVTQAESGRGAIVCSSIVMVVAGSEPIRGSDLAAVEEISPGAFSRTIHEILRLLPEVL